MPRGDCTFRKRDVAAAIAGARQAGLEVERVEIDREGKIVLHTARPESPGELAASMGGSKKGKPWFPAK